MLIHGPGINVSFEGISGCGKSYILMKLRDVLQDVLLTIIEEIEDRQGAGLDQKIIALLGKSGDRFFRGGHPRTETLLLLALQAYEAETIIGPALAAGQTVIENRSIDTIAIYQAIILHPSESLERQLERAQQLYQFACQWRTPPQLTFLLEDDFVTAIERSQQRVARLYSLDEIALMRRAAHIYELYAQCQASRIVRLDRRRMETENIVQTIRETIIARLREGR
jgi:dTMP kinase